MGNAVHMKSLPVHAYNYGVYSFDMLVMTDGSHMRESGNVYIPYASPVML